MRYGGRKEKPLQESRRQHFRLILLTLSPLFVMNDPAFIGKK